jgi:FkbM family methyltransferase
MFLQLWGMRAAKACAALSAAGLYRRKGRGLPPPVLVDIGARGGLQKKWRAYRRLAPLHAVMIEADPEEAAKLQRQDPQASIVAAALGEQAGTGTLHVTSDPGCSSLLRPTAQAQALPSVGYRLGIVRTIDLALSRADAVFRRDNLPQPDFLKLDTQGTEISVLKGFGALLDKVVGIEIECEFQTLYEGQPLITDVVEFLQHQGFALVALRPNGIAEEGILDTNAYFVRREKMLDTRQRLLAKVWRRLNRVPTHFSYVIASG